jgi:phospholipid/cholesterol/gamma-HCH transport system substrate-binding protein
MNEPSDRRPVWVGLFIFIGLVFLLGGILMVGNLHETFKRKIQVISFFDDVNGLKKGDNVWFSGVKVGTVNSIYFHSRTKVEVFISVDVKAQVYIRRDSKVKISTDGLLGNKILVIYGGSENSAGINAGDTLSVEKTFVQEDMVSTLQESNKNLLAITNDMKIISKRLVSGEGTAGKLLSDNSLYNHADATAASLQRASLKAEKLFNTLNEFGDKLNKQGTLANEVVTDTITFSSLRLASKKIKSITDSAAQLVNHLKTATDNKTTPVGILLHDQQEGARLKMILRNLESSTRKLDEDLEAAQHSFLLRKFFKKRKHSPQVDSIRLKSK